MKIEDKLLSLANTKKAMTDFTSLYGKDKPVYAKYETDKMPIRSDKYFEQAKKVIEKLKNYHPKFAQLNDYFKETYLSNYPVFAEVGKTSAAEIQLSIDDIKKFAEQIYLQLEGQSIVDINDIMERASFLCPPGTASNMELILSSVSSEFNNQQLEEILYQAKYQVIQAVTLEFVREVFPKLREGEEVHVVNYYMRSLKSIKFDILEDPYSKPMRIKKVFRDYLLDNIGLYPGLVISSQSIAAKLNEIEARYLQRIDEFNRNSAIVTNVVNIVLNSFEPNIHILFAEKSERIIKKLQLFDPEISAYFISEIIYEAHPAYKKNYEKIVEDVVIRGIAKKGYIEIKAIEELKFEEEVGAELLNVILSEDERLLKDFFSSNELSSFSDMLDNILLSILYQGNARSLEFIYHSSREVRHPWQAELDWGSQEISQDPRSTASPSSGMTRQGMEISAYIDQKIESSIASAFLESNVQLNKLFWNRLKTLYPIANEKIAKAIEEEGVIKIAAELFRKADAINSLDELINERESIKSKINELFFNIDITDEKNIKFWKQPRISSLITGLESQFTIEEDDLFLRLRNLEALGLFERLANELAEEFQPKVLSIVYENLGLDIPADKRDYAFFAKLNALNLIPKKRILRSGDLALIKKSEDLGLLKEFFDGNENAYEKIYGPLIFSDASHIIDERNIEFLKQTNILPLITFERIDKSLGNIACVIKRFRFLKAIDAIGKFEEYMAQPNKNQEISSIIFNAFVKMKVIDQEDKVFLKKQISVADIYNTIKANKDLEIIVSLLKKTDDIGLLEDLIKEKENVNNSILRVFVYLKILTDENIDFWNKIYDLKIINYKKICFPEPGFDFLKKAALLPKLFEEIYESNKEGVKQTILKGFISSEKILKEDLSIWHKFQDLQILLAGDIAKAIKTKDNFNLLVKANDLGLLEAVTEIYKNKDQIKGFIFEVFIDIKIDTQEKLDFWQKMEDLKLISAENIALVIDFGNTKKILVLLRKISLFPRLFEAVANKIRSRIDVQEAIFKSCYNMLCDRSFSVSSATLFFISDLNIFRLLPVKEIANLLEQETDANKQFRLLRVLYALNLLQSIVSNMHNPGMIKKVFFEHLLDQDEISTDDLPFWNNLKLSGLITAEIIAPWVKSELIDLRDFLKIKAPGEIGRFKNAKSITAENLLPFLEYYPDINLINKVNYIGLFRNGIKNKQNSFENIFHKNYGESSLYSHLFIENPSSVLSSEVKQIRYKDTTPSQALSFWVNDNIYHSNNAAIAFMFAIKAGIERFSAIKYIGREIVDPIIGPYIPEVIKHSDVWNILDNDNVKFAAHFIFSFVGGALIKSEWRSSFFYSSIGTGLLLTKSLSADFLTAGAIKIAINTVIDFTYMYAINPALGNFNHILFYQGVVNTIQILDYNLKHNIDYELSKEGLSIARFVVDGGIILGSSYGINFTPVHLHEMVYSIMRVYNTIEMVALIDSLLCSMKPKLKPLEVDMEVNKVAETCVDYGYLNVYEGICSGEDAILEVEAILH